VKDGDASPRERLGYEFCIRLPNSEIYSLCGRDVAQTHRRPSRREFFYIDVNHWFNNRQSEGRIVGCRKCLAVLRKHTSDELAIMGNEE